MLDLQARHDQGYSLLRLPISSHLVLLLQLLHLHFRSLLQYLPQSRATRLLRNHSHNRTASAINTDRERWRV
jgi:hypothetical protein